MRGLLGFRSVTALAATIAVGAVCTSANPIVPADRLIPLGMWGGKGAGMIVADTGLHLHIGCTSGDIAGRVSVTGAGLFENDGVYRPYAYPVQEGPQFPAHFRGLLNHHTVSV